MLGLLVITPAAAARDHRQQQHKQEASHVLVCSRASRLTTPCKPVPILGCMYRSIKVVGLLLLITAWWSVVGEAGRAGTAAARVVCVRPVLLAARQPSLTPCMPTCGVMQVTGPLTQPPLRLPGRCSLLLLRLAGHGAPKGGGCVRPSTTPCLHQDQCAITIDPCLLRPLLPRKCLCVCRCCSRAAALPVSLLTPTSSLATLLCRDQQKQQQQVQPQHMGSSTSSSMQHPSSSSRRKQPAWMPVCSSAAAQGTSAATQQPQQACRVQPPPQQQQAHQSRWCSSSWSQQLPRLQDRPAQQPTVQEERHQRRHHQQQAAAGSSGRRPCGGCSTSPSCRTVRACWPPTRRRAGLSARLTATSTAS